MYPCFQVYIIFVSYFLFDPPTQSDTYNYDHQNDGHDKDISDS